MSENIYLKAALRAARLAGEVIKRIRSEGQLNLAYKAERNYITAADLASEKCIKDEILAAFPSHAILAEETQPCLDVKALWGDLWIIDPIDGTTNFARGFQHWGISIAYAHNGETQCGVVYAPDLDRTYSAVRNQGAQCNQQQISASSATELKKALVATGFPYIRDNVPLLTSRVEQVITQCEDLRRSGCASLDICYVADGKLEVYYESVSPWDVAAGKLIARESGAKMGFIAESHKDQHLPPELRGRELLVAAPGIYADILDLLRACSSVKRS
jgi:myo-inositol-1(or 4)-monophosphatase